MKRAPLICVFLSFAVGIGLTAQFGTSPLLISSVLLFFSALWLLFTRRLLSLKFVFVCLFLLTGSIRFLQSQVRAANDIFWVPAAFVAVTGRITSDVHVHGDGKILQRKASFTMEAQTVEQEASGIRIPVGGLVQVTLPLSDPADVSVTPHYGETLRIRARLERPDHSRNPSGFDYASFLERRGISRTLSPRHPSDWRIVQDAPNNPMMQLAFGVNSRIRTYAHKSFSPLKAQMLTGILFGEKTELPMRVQDALERTGTSHILATAGLHVGVVTGLLLYGFRVAGVPRRGNYFLVMFFLICYAVMAGGRPSVVRAALMACIYLFGRLIEREPDMFTSLMTAGLVLLISNPLNLFDMGFQLSFATVMTILLVMPLAERVPHWINTKIPGWSPPERIARSISLTLTGCFFLSVAAQIGSFPLVWHYFNEISVVAVFANVLVVPLLAPVMGASVLAVLLSVINPVLASPLNGLIDFLLGLILRIVEQFSAPTWAAFAAEPPPIWLLFVYYLLLWGCLVFLRPNAKEEDRSLETQK